jgi:hypothetical protein
MKGSACHFLQALESCVCRIGDDDCRSFRTIFDGSTDYGLRIPEAEKPLLFIVTCIRGWKRQPVEYITDLTVRAILSLRRTSRTGLEDFMEELNRVYEDSLNAKRDTYNVLIPEDFFILANPPVYSDVPHPSYQAINLPWGTVSFHDWATYIEPISSYVRPGYEYDEIGRFPDDINQFAPLVLSTESRSSHEAYLLAQKTARIIACLYQILSGDSIRYSRSHPRGFRPAIYEPPFMAVFLHSKEQNILVDRVYGPKDRQYMPSLLLDSHWNAWEAFFSPFYVDYRREDSSIHRLISAMELLAEAIWSPTIEYGYLSLWCCLECLSDAPNGQTKEVCLRLRGLFLDPTQTLAELEALAVIRNRMVHNVEWIGNGDQAFRALLRIAIEAIERFRERGDYVYLCRLPSLFQLLRVRCKESEWKRRGLLCLKRYTWQDQPCCMSASGWKLG